MLSFFSEIVFNPFFRSQENPVSQNFVQLPWLNTEAVVCRYVLQNWFKVGVLKRFANFTGKHLCWSLLLNNVQAEALQLC